MGERTAVRTGSAFRLPKKRKYIRKKQRQYLPLHAVKRTIACTRSRGGVMPTFQNDPNPVSGILVTQPQNYIELRSGSP